jgi:uncharacterized protein
MPKFVLLLAIIAALVWLTRRGRRRVSGGDAAPPPAVPKEAMVPCAQCGLHLPNGEALPGRGGLFCSEAHRAQFEQSRR